MLKIGVPPYPSLASQTLSIPQLAIWPGLRDYPLPPLHPSRCCSELYDVLQTRSYTARTNATHFELDSGPASVVWCWRSRIEARVARVSRLSEMFLSSSWWDNRPRPVGSSAVLKGVDWIRPSERGSETSHWRTSEDWEVASGSWRPDCDLSDFQVQGVSGCSSERAITAAPCSKAGKYLPWAVRAVCTQPAQSSITCVQPTATAPTTQVWCYVSPANYALSTRIPTYTLQ